MMAHNNKFPAYDKDMKSNHFPLLGIATKVVYNEKNASLTHFLQMENKIAEIKKNHKNNYEQQMIFLDDKKFPYFYYKISSQLNEQPKKFPFEQMINYNSKEEIQIRPQKICNKFPIYVKEEEEKKFPFVGKMYNDINLNENMSTIFMRKIPQITTTITKMATNLNNNFDKQEFPLNFQLEIYTFEFPLNNNNSKNNICNVEENSKDKFMTPSILYVEKIKNIDERVEQDQVHMAMYNKKKKNKNNNEIQKFNEQQKKIPKEKQQEEHEQQFEKNVAINKHNNNNNIVEEKQVEQTTIIMLEAFCKNEQKENVFVVVDKSSTIATTTATPTTTTTTIDEIEHFENNRGKQIDEKNYNNNNNNNNSINEGKSNNNNNNNNLFKMSYLINKQTETAKNVEKIHFEFENIVEKSSDVCEQSTQEDRGQLNTIFNNNNNNNQAEKEEQEVATHNNEINLNLNVMGLTNFSHEGSALSEQLEVVIEKELLIDSSIDLGADMKHDRLNASNNKNMPEQKHNYADLNKTSFTTYPRAKEATDFARKYLPNLVDDKTTTTATTTTTTNEPTCSAIRKSSTNVDVTSVLPERTLLRRQRRSLTQKSKSEQEEDPVERLNRLRARISGALCQVKGVLKQYSTDNVEEATQNCSSIPAAVSAPQEQEKSSDADSGPISFRFVKKVRRRSSFDERVVLEVPKELTEKETKEEGSSEAGNTNESLKNAVENEINQERNVEKIEPLTLDLIDETKAKKLFGNETNENLKDAVKNETKIEQVEVKNEAEIKPIHENIINETQLKKLDENERRIEQVEDKNEVKNKKLDGNETKLDENETQLKKLDKNETKLDEKETKLKKLDENETKYEKIEDLINETQTQQSNKDLTIETNSEQLNEELQLKNKQDESEGVSKEVSENDETKKTGTQKTKVKKRIFVVKTKGSSARRASVAAVELSKIADHTEHISPTDGAIRVHRRPSDSEAIIKKNNNLINNNNTTILNLGDTEKLLEIGYETLQGNETQQLHAQHKKKLNNNNNNNKKNIIVQVHSKVKQKAHDTPLAKTNEHVAADIDIINNNNNNQHQHQHHHKNVNNLQDEQQVRVELNKDQCATDCNHKANKTDHIDNDMKLESNAIDIEREQLKVTDHAQVLSATIATDATACNSFAKSTEHITPEISCAADIAMPELQSLPARVLLTSAVADVPSEDPPFNQLLIKHDEQDQNKQVIKLTNSIDAKETVNAETQTPNLLLATNTAESHKESVKSKPRKVKKKVIIKRQQRRLSVSDTGFFREPVSEDGQSNGAAVDVETLEKPISYETDDESTAQLAQTEEEQPEAEPEELQPEPLRSCLKAREFQVGDWVMYAERYKKTLVRWKKGQVIERITSISYKLDIDGKEVPAHISYIKKYTDRKVNFGGKEYLEINYEQIEEEEEQERRYSIWNLV